MQIDELEKPGASGKTESITEEQIEKLFTQARSGGKTELGSLYAQSLFQDMMAQMLAKKSRHNKARALRAKSRINKRKAKRKA